METTPRSDYTPEKVADLIAEARTIRRLADALEAEHDRAEAYLSVIAEAKRFIINDTSLYLSGSMPGRIILDILSRIPEHPKED